VPTYDWDQQFINEFNRLPPADKILFRQAVQQVIADLKAARPFHPRLRVKAVQGTTGIIEVTWDMPNGRATFNFEKPRRAGEAHIHWRRIGGHDILKQP
jgi:hypothetical protein